MKGVSYSPSGACFPLTPCFPLSGKVASVCEPIEDKKKQADSGYKNKFCAVNQLFNKTRVVSAAVPVVFSAAAVLFAAYKLYRQLAKFV